jgi:hypothetical protein
MEKVNLRTFHDHPQLEKRLGLDDKHVIIDYHMFILVREYLYKHELNNSDKKFFF